MSDDRLPDPRASDADRERTVELLRRAGADGQLTFDELEDRLGKAYGARTRGELAALTGDLHPAGLAAPAGDGYVVHAGAGGARWLLAILSGTDRRGRWRLAERCTVVNVMGGSNLDLTEVELAAERVELTVYSLMGGAEIRVPEGLNVAVSDFGFMGGNSVDIGPEHPSPGGPVLNLNLVSVMGGSNVERGPKLSRSERKELKRRKCAELDR